MFLFKPIQDSLIKASCNAVFGILVFIGLIFLIRRLADFAEIKQPQVGSFRMLIVGLVAGAILSCAAAVSFSQINHKPIEPSGFFEVIRTSSIAHIPYAVTEEAVFRFGIVGGVTNLSGMWPGILAGSVPFGVLHLINLLFGTPVDFQQIIGITVAGIFLSLLYLRFGLWAPIGCHYIWNALLVFWIASMDMDKAAGVVALEGAWSTSLILSIMALLLLRKV